MRFILSNLKAASLAVATLILVGADFASAQTATPTPTPVPLRRRGPRQVVPAAAPAPVAPAPVSAPVAEVSRYTTGLKLNAFIDPEFRYATKDTSPGRGFTINDAALTLSKEFDQMRALVDLPFYSDTSGGTNRFVFADREAQAFLEFDRWENQAIRVGQYDSFFGVEANHSRDRFFANYGLLKTYFVPFTHTGVQYQYGHAQGLSVRGQITDPNGDGALAQNNLEIAGNLRYQVNTGYGAVSASYNQNPNVNSQYMSNTLVEVMGGFAEPGFRLDGEVDYKRTAGTNNDGLGVGVYAAIPTGPAWAIGARGEYGHNVYASIPNVGYGSFDSVFALAVGPSYKFTPDVTMRGDLSYDTLNSGNYNTSYLGLNLSVVAQL